jgi:hypothetical protein
VERGPVEPCALLTEQAGEPLGGTASTDGSTFFLVRHRGPWPRKAIEGSELPRPLQERLAAATKATSGRALLVRGPVREPDPKELYVVRTVPGERFMLRFAFPSFEAMGELDMLEVAARGEHAAAERLEEPIFLVCTHGRRDACCALRGMAVIKAIQDQHPGRVFQTSHVGGHRFAANAISLPDGFCYGRVTPAEAPLWIEATDRGHVFDLARVRGRTCFDAPAQAAELFLRSAIAETGHDAIALEGVSAEDDRHRVIFRAGDARHEVVVAKETIDGSRPASCGAEPTPITRYVLVEHRAGRIG